MRSHLPLELGDGALVVHRGHPQDERAQWAEPTADDKRRSEVDQPGASVSGAQDIALHVTMKNTARTRRPQNLVQRREEVGTELMRIAGETIASINMLHHQRLATDASQQSRHSCNSLEPTIGGGFTADQMSAGHRTKQPSSV